MRPGWRARGWLAAAAVFPPMVTCALLPLRERTLSVNLALVLVLAVLAAGTFAGRVGGLLAACTATLSYDLLLTRPYNSLRIDEVDDLLTTVLLAAVGVTAAVLVERVRRHAADAANAERSLRHLERMNELTSGSDSAQRVIRLACDELTALLDLKACRYQAGPAPAGDVRLEHGTVRVPAGAAPVPGGRVVLPVRNRSREVGHFVLVFPHPSVGLDVSGATRRAAAAVADAVGTSFADRARSSDDRHPA